MRAGHYAVLDGTEYEALVIADGRWIFLPTDAPRPEGWKLDATRRRWSKRVERNNISSMCHVTTLAMLGDVEVRVNRLDPVEHTAYVMAKNPLYTGINHSDAPSPHPLLSVTLDPPYSIEWTGTVAWAALTDVHELVSQVDPLTGDSAPD